MDLMKNQSIGITFPGLSVKAYRVVKNRGDFIDDFGKYHLGGEVSFGNFFGQRAQIIISGFLIHPQKTAGPNIRRNLWGVHFSSLKNGCVRAYSLLVSTLLKILLTTK